jgi:uncharacterized protein (TIGR02996 family)
MASFDRKLTATLSVLDEAEQTGWAAALQNNSDDLTRWLIYADWLEERGDSRSDIVRQIGGGKFYPKETSGLEPWGTRGNKPVRYISVWTWCRWPGHDSPHSRRQPPKADILPEELFDHLDGGDREGWVITSSIIHTYSSHMLAMQDVAKTLTRRHPLN